MKIKRAFVVGFCLLTSVFLVVPVFADEEQAANDENAIETTEGVEAGEALAEYATGDAKTCIKHAEVIDFGALQEKGRTYTKELTVRNICVDTHVIKAEIVPYENDDLSNDNKAASDWLVLMGGVDTYVIGTEASKNINSRVTLPLEVAGGSYYAYLKLTSDDGTLDEKVPIRLDVYDDSFAFGGELKKADFKIFNHSGDLNGEIELTNNGNAGFTVTASATLKPLFGGEEDIFYEDSWEALPGVTEKRYPRTLGDIEEEDASEGSLNGIYKASYNISYVNNEGRVIDYRTSRIVISLQKKTIIIIAGAVVGLIILIAIVKASAGAVKRKKTNKKYKDVDNEL